MTNAEHPSPQPNQSPSPEDKRLERLYDYTKFHIGIYLSAAGALAALLGTKEAGWIVSYLIGNEYLLYIAFGLMVIAGMCGGIVATGITESKTFEEFWSERDHFPATIESWSAKGSVWVHREHGFFWLSLLFLAASILIRWPGPPVQPAGQSTPEHQCCCCEAPRSASAATK